MPPRWPSRHSFCTGLYRDPQNNGYNVLMLTDRIPYRYRQIEDTIVHKVIGGETIYQIAGYYYKGAFTRPAGLWWIIADFQPDPIFDPTIALKDGSLLYIPSIRTVNEFILNESRRLEYDEYL